MDYLHYDWHDAILEKNSPTIVECLGYENGDVSNGAKIVSITKTDKGYRFSECCDSYFGATLSQEQMERFILELQEMAGIDAGQP